MKLLPPPAMGRAPDPIGGAVGFLSFIKDKEGEKDDAAMKSAAQLAITGAQGFLTFIPPSPVLHSSSGMRSPPNDRKPRFEDFLFLREREREREEKGERGMMMIMIVYFELELHLLEQYQARANREVIHFFFSFFYLSIHLK